MIRLFSKSKLTVDNLVSLLSTDTVKFKINRNDLLFYYLYFFRLIFETLDRVYGPATKNTKFTPPSTTLVHTYSLIVNFFYRIREYPKIYGLPRFDEIDFFDPLNGDFDRLNRDWLKYKGKFIDHLAYVENFNRLESVCNLNIPPKLKELSDLLHEEINKHMRYLKLKCADDDYSEYKFPADILRDRQDRRIYHFGSKHISFTSTNSQRMSIFAYIFNKRGDWIRTEEIAKTIKRDKPYVRQVIRDLKKKLKPVGFTIQMSGGTVSKARMIPSNLAR